MAKSYLIKEIITRFKIIIINLDTNYSIINFEGISIDIFVQEIIIDINFMEIIINIFSKSNIMHFNFMEIVTFNNFKISNDNIDFKDKNIHFMKIFTKVRMHFINIPMEIIMEKQLTDHNIDFNQHLIA